MLFVVMYKVPIVNGLFVIISGATRTPGRPGLSRPSGIQGSLIVRERKCSGLPSFCGQFPIFLYREAGVILAFRTSLFNTVIIFFKKYAKCLMQLLSFQ